MARLNENENENESSGGSRDGLFAGSLYNTYKIAKQAFVMDPASGKVARSATIPEFEAKLGTGGGWDAENKGWVYVRDFMRLNPKWFDDLKDLPEVAWKGWDLSAEVGKTPLDHALCDIVDAAGEREDRFAEILHQRDAEGCISYWISMLGIDPVKHGNTYQLIRVGRKLGEMIVMCLKAHFNAARPSQICPAIVPAFDPPRTAAYPAGHALQSYLISFLLLRAMPGMKSQSPPPTKWDDVHKGLFALARRVADNRVIAGVHFDIDNEAGFYIAEKIDTWFGVWEKSPVDKLPTRDSFDNFRDLLAKASAEFPQWK